MINHVSIGVRDLAKAKAFYDAALGALGYQCLSANPDSLGYGQREAELWILAVSAPVLADPRSGLHLCFSAPSRAAVDAFHGACIARGGRDNGRPGLRAEYAPSYYAAFAMDPDGYRLEAYCNAQAS